MMKGMISAIIVGVIGIIGFVVISTIITSGVLTGTDVGTTLVRTLFPLAFGSMIVLAVFIGLMSLVKGAGAGD